MKSVNLSVIRHLLAAAALTIGGSEAAAADKAPRTPAIAPLTSVGEKLQARYAAMLAGLKAEVAKAVPTVDEPQKAAFRKAREAVKKAEADANAAQQALIKVQQAKALVDHAKGKWLGGAEKGLAKAADMLKKATADAERAAAEKERAKWQADKEAGQKALAERLAALERAKVDEPKLAQANRTAQEALARARADETAAAQAVLTATEPFLASDALDATLVKCVVLAAATPRGLAEFSQEGKEQEALVEKLLADVGLMQRMLEADGAKEGKYGPAVRILEAVRKASPRAEEGILQRLALGVALEHAVPIAQRNALADVAAPTVVDPVKRYLHYEKAYLDGELDPAFPTMTAWECRMIVDCEAPDHVLAWGREMLRNYRPDHIFNPDYAWRYSGAVRTDVAYRHSQEYVDADSLEFFQNVCKNGGICGRRAFFGRFIIRSFGLPSWGVTQKAHAAVGRWTPAGWVVNLGANWQHSWYEGRSGLDFLSETQARKHPQEYKKVLRAQWVGDALGEPKFQSLKPGSGGWWNELAQMQKQAIVAAAKPVELAAVGQDLAEADESLASKATAIGKAVVTEADKRISIAEDGVVTIPAAVCGKGNQLVKSFLGGQQMLCGGAAFGCEVDVPAAGKYLLSAYVVTVHDEMKLQLTPNESRETLDLVIPYTCGHWKRTAPVEVVLTQGKNVLSFSKPSENFALKELTLTPVK